MSSDAVSPSPPVAPVPPWRQPRRLLIAAVVALGVGTGTWYLVQQSAQAPAAQVGSSQQLRTMTVSGHAYTVSPSWIYARLVMPAGFGVAQLTLVVTRQTGLAQTPVIDAPLSVVPTDTAIIEPFRVTRPGTYQVVWIAGSHTLTTTAVRVAP